MVGTRMSRSKSRALELPLPPPAIGIDLGTSFSSVGVLENGKVTIIANDHRRRRTPSYVAFTGSEPIIGDAAKNLVMFNPANTIFDALRLVGRRFGDPLVQGFIKNLPFEVISDDVGRPKFSVEVNGERKSFSPEEICSMILDKMKTTAEKHLGRTVTDAVVTVPANFSQSQRQAIRHAATIAGLNVRFLASPVAAAIGHYFHDGIGIPKFGRGVKNVLVFDLGGGTLDVAILTIEDGICEVKSTASDNHLGGEDFVNKMLTHFVAEFMRKHGKDITTKKGALLGLRNACETAKKILCDSFQAFIKIDALFDGIDFHESITRLQFEALNADLFNNLLKPVGKCLRDAKMEKSQIADVILVGGSTQIPKIHQLLEAYFNNRKVEMQISDEAVACGAALYAAVLSGDKSKKVNGGEGGRQSRKRKADGRLQKSDVGGSGSRGSTKNQDAAEDLMVIDLVNIYRSEPMNNVLQDTVAVNKQILQEEIATDFTIVCESGAEIKCHKVFLCAQSGVLRAMIEDQDGANNVLEMAGMMEQSVDAFLAFLYYRDTTVASKDSAIAFELVRAAHLYYIKSLEIAMEELILTKEISWFDVDDAVRLFAFARRIKKGQDLKMKAVEVLKQNTSILDQSDCYKELYKDDPESAMDLFKCALSK